MGEHPENGDWGIDRRTVLRGAAASGIGFVGVTGFSGSVVAGGHGGGGQPCHKDFECEDEDATYVKIEFVEVYEDTDDDGEEELVDCYFEEETDTGLVWVTDWESKDGEECDPISVTLEYAKGFTASKVKAYGGNDCDTKTVDVSEGEVLESYDSGLVNGGGNTAAISNLQFCIVEAPIFGTGEVAFGYEDLPVDDSDWDVNDLVVDMNMGFTSAGVSSEGLPEVTELTFDIIPQALGAGDDHEWRLEFEDEEICEGSYTLDYYDTDGNQVGSTEIGDVPGVITVFDSTQALFDDHLANAQRPGNESCEKPNMWAQLTITFDATCPLDIPTAACDCDVNGSDLFFGPVLENLDEGEVVGRGDMRLVVVPDQWEWPLGAVKIWDAYDEVDPGPVYTTDEWYMGEKDDSLVTNCNFEPADDNSIYSV